MALPWLIGGLALAAGAALVKKLNEDDDTSSSYDYEMESRRREEAERERKENERKKKLEAARENFAIRGESLGRDIAQSLNDWIDVDFENSPAFSAKLNSKGYKIKHAISNEQDISTLLPSKNHQFDEIRENLKVYSDIYRVRLKKGTKLVEAGKEIEMIEAELKQINKLKAEILRLQHESFLSTVTCTEINKPASRETLLKFFESLQGQFDSSLATALDQEKKFEAMRRKFMRRFSAHLSDARNSLPDSNPLKHQVLGFVDLMEKTQAEWDKKVAGRKKGVEFRQGFEDSLLVFVNGKVKSGKSSLGNFMAWGHTDPDEELKRQVPAGLVPRYFSHKQTNVDGYDTENEAQRHREFRVGAIEATSSIQGFKLPGLTWVDSPGLHSVKTEDENLARDYIEHADLIVYTMRSDSPGRQSDLAEVKLLLGKEKKVLLLLTGSDDVDEDWSDEAECLVSTVVMKDAQRREMQRAYVRQALEESCGAENTANIEIVSFSARYAQLNAGDSAAFSESGMELLCETLHRIAQSDGVRIKQRTPLANMRTFLQSCHDDLRPYSDFVSCFKQPLEDLKQQRSDKKFNTHMSSIYQDIERLLGNLRDEIADFENQLDRMLLVTKLHD